MIANIILVAMYQNHIKDGADISIAYTSVHNADTDFERCYLLNLGKTGRVVSVGVNMEITENLLMFLWKFIL